MKNPMYVIVRFDLQNGQIDRLSSLVQRFFKEEVSTYPGFISSKLHRNEDGTVLINYACWESNEAFNKFRSELAKGSELSLQIRNFKQTTDLVYELPY